MSRKLTQAQRLIAAIIYLLIIGVCFSLLGGNISRILDSSYDESIWFYSGVLLIIMGQYVTEPFFSTPADSLANSITLVLALLSINNKNTLIGYNFLLVFSICMTVLSIISILYKDKSNKFSTFIYIIVKNLGSSKLLYSIVFLLSSYSYFADNEHMPLFIISITIWICIVFLGLVERMIKFLCQLKNILVLKDSSSLLGYAVKCSNMDIYTIELEKNDANHALFNNEGKIIVLIKTDNETFSFGIVINCITLLNSLWLDVTLIHDNQHSPITLHQSQISSILSTAYSSQSIGTSWSVNYEKLDKNLKEKIEASRFFQRFSDFIGYVEQGSNIDTINFIIVKNNCAQIKDGAIISTFIYGQEVLYQIINGYTREEKNDTNSSSGYICGLARKLGVYDYSSNQLDVVNWVPNMGEKVYLHKAKTDIDLKELAELGIGRMPETDMIIKIADINSLVTHNTAILGILGIGKSCLTFELIKKITDNNIKAICIDITNQYYSEKGLIKYIANDLIVNDICDEKQRYLAEQATKTGAENRPSDWGNVEVYKQCIHEILDEFINDDNKILILNPDNHIVTKPASQFRISELAELSVAEKTQIISEVLLELFMKKGQSDIARCCLIYEEAHSLVPEWNSVTNSGDDRAAIGTAKVILQGRKYGLGCIIVTQRTANVTKSILNQCNTIFALRVFDETGKDFLKNYIGKDYSDTLPTLEERHAIIIGKALKLKQPVIIQLNDMRYFLIEDNVEASNQNHNDEVTEATHQ